MSKLQRLCTAAALALCALAPPAALAAGKVLYLSTAEQYNGGTASNPCKGYPEDSDTLTQGKPYKNGNAATSGRGFVQNSVNAFSAKATGGFFNRAGALSTTNQIGRAKDGTTFTNDSTNWEAAKADFSQLSAGDVVVVQTAYQLMDTKKAEFIAQQIKTRKDLTFFLLLDTCSECSFNSDTCTVASSTANLDSILKPAINQTIGWRVYGKHLNGSNKPIFTPNTGSPYYSKLNPKINPLKGHTVGTMQCTPKQNVIYSLPSAYPDPSSMPATSSSWPELNENSSYGTFVPFWQSNYGKGACLYMATDNNMFDNTTGGITQHNNIAQMVMNMYKGACQVTAEQAGICTGINLSAGERCQLVNAPAGTPASELVVQATADGVCKNQMWKIFPPGAPVPTTSWPALFGLGALLPLLATRRRRRK